MPRAIRTSLDVAAAPEVVHDLLTDIAAWATWSPHVASVSPDHGRVAPGDVVATRAFFAPVATPMHVDAVEPGRGLTWHTTALGHTLRYENRVEPGATGLGTARLVFTARIEGPGARVLTAVAAPLSALGQRRRMARLARLAELVARQR